MHEPVLRLPSTLASAAGAYILFQLGRKLLNARAALVAVLLFVCAEPVAFAAADARPYAIATTVALAAMLMLVRWCETQQAGDGVLYCLLAALTLYFHFVFATTLLVHLVYAAYRLRFRGRAMAGPVLTGGALVLVFSIPLMPFALALARSARSHSFAGTPDWTDLFS